MKNPKINRWIGYIIMFIGFYFVYKGSHAGTAENGIDGYDPVVFAFAIVLVIVSWVWMFFMVRCPHCNGILHYKFYNIDRCPHCGKRTY